MKNAYLQSSIGAAALFKTRESQFCSVSEAARALDVSPSTIWRWIEAEKLPAYRVGPKKIRIKKEDLETIIRPARIRREEVAESKERAVSQPPSQDEIARRQALVARILARRKERVIAPETTADLVGKVRKQERKSHASW
ncbi:MAG: helix-turn-helix domain-containing protein [Chloroflexi bacterium]|nr:helix-turn-helix domain-containing protein [Chloroflexota bacterium]